MGIRLSDNDRQRTADAFKQHAGPGPQRRGDLPGGRELYLLFAVGAATVVLLAFFIALIR